MCCISVVQMHNMHVTFMFNWRRWRDELNEGGGMCLVHADVRCALLPIDNEAI